MDVKFPNNLWFKWFALERTKIITLHIFAKYELILKKTTIRFVRFIYLFIFLFES